MKSHEHKAIAEKILRDAENQVKTTLATALDHEPFNLDLIMSVASAITLSLNIANAHAYLANIPDWNDVDV